MKKDLLEIIDEIVALLTKCNLREKANWFRIKAKRLKGLEQNSKEYKDELLEIKSIIAGMGSFSDLPMYPKKGSGLSEEEASNKQWDLAAKLGEAISKSL